MAYLAGRLYWEGGGGGERGGDWVSLHTLVLFHIIVYKTSPQIGTDLTPNG